MTTLSSDFLRLHIIYFEDLPSDINQKDLWKATSLGASFGAKPTPDIERKFDLNPVASIERVCRALAKHAKLLKKMKSDEVGAPTRQRYALPTSTINFIAWEMLVRCNNDEIAPPTELLNLIRLLLNIRSQEKADEEELLAWKMDETALFLYCNPDASFHDAAKQFEVDVSTISRWNKKNNLLERGQILNDWREQIDEHAKAVQAEIQDAIEKQNKR
jgi:hypothetical protein